MDRTLIRSVSTYEGTCLKEPQVKRSLPYGRSDAAASRRAYFTGRLAIGRRNALSLCRAKKVQSRGTHFADGLQAEAPLFVVQSLRSNPFDVGERQNGFW
jgi:hypothetical protein